MDTTLASYKATRDGLKSEASLARAIETKASLSEVHTALASLKKKKKGLEKVKIDAQAPKSFLDKDTSLLDGIKWLSCAAEENSGAQISTRENGANQ